MRQHPPPSTACLGDYTIRSANLQGAERKNVEDEDRLPISPVYDSYEQAKLGESVLVSLAQLAPDRLVVSATLLDDGGVISKGDELDVLYEMEQILPDASRPPWVELFEAARAAIRGENSLAPLPLLISGFDNYIFRQLLLRAIWEGDSPSEAYTRLEQYNSGGHLNRYDLAEDGCSDIVGTEVGNSQYATSWQQFRDDIINARHEVVHPTSDVSIDTLSREDAISLYDQTLDFCVDMYDFIRT